MEQGLAQQLVYGEGKGQNMKHFYAKKGLLRKKSKKCGKKVQKR